LLGNAARVHPTLVIFCFLAGGALFGIVGVILAVPVALTVKVVLATIYDEPIGRRQREPTARRIAARTGHETFPYLARYIGWRRCIAERAA